MTINSVTEMWSRKGSTDASPDGRQYVETYASAYQVEHTADETESNIRNATGIPALRSVYPGTNYVYCTDRQVEKVGPIFSIVNVSWKGETASDGTSPTNQATTWKMQAVVTEEETDMDGFGQPLTNVNGEPVTGLTRDVWDWQLTVSKNFDSFNTYALQNYANAVNADHYGPPGNLWPPGTGRIKGIEIEPTDSGALSFIRGSMTLLFRTPYNTTPLRAHWHRYLNQGVYERVGTFITFTDAPAGENTATGYAVVSSSNVITAIVVTNPGSGYTVAPTVTITGDGSGASATATINSNGRVTGVNIGAGGTGYTSKIIRAVDGQGDPVTQPLLLNQFGQRSDELSEAVWIERPKYGLYLPYSSLGFNF